MTGTTLTFKKRVQTGTDDFNNPITTTEDIVVEDCLIAPITEPTNIREQQALEQSRDQVRIHIPRDSTDDLGGSTVEWDGKEFAVDSDSVSFMLENTPGRWARYFRAEAIVNG